MPLENRLGQLNDFNIHTKMFNTNKWCHIFIQSGALFYHNLQVRNTTVNNTCSDVWIGRDVRLFPLASEKSWPNPYLHPFYWDYVKNIVLLNKFKKFMHLQVKCW